MQRTYRMWDAEALRINLPLTDEAKTRLINKLASGGSVVIEESVLMKVQRDGVFVTNENPSGQFVLALYGQGETLAVANSASQTDLHKSILWAEGVAKEKTEALVCCCCGSMTRGRQWWNRDNGYGLCKQCITFVGDADVPVGAEARSYGVRGYHYDLPDDPN